MTWQKKLRLIGFIQMIAPTLAEKSGFALHGTLRGGVLHFTIYMSCEGEYFGLGASVVCEKTNSHKILLRKTTMWTKIISFARNILPLHTKEPMIKTRKKWKRFQPFSAIVGR